MTPGDLFLEGPFTESMIATLHALIKNYEVVKMFLDLVLGEELIGWVNGKNGSRTRPGARVKR